MAKEKLIKKSSELERNEQLNALRREADYDTYDMSISEIMGRIKKGSIDMAPVYQRVFRWNEQKQSLFIESLFLDIPIPVIFVAKNDNNKWEVIDGVQRLHTVLRFAGEEEVREKFSIDDNLILNGLEKLTSFNGLEYDDLSQSMKDLLDDQSLRIIALSRDTAYSVRFDLFERINKGSSVLSDQEIRSCIFVGRFLEMVEDLSKDANFKKIVKLPASKVKESLDEEYILRFFALLFKEKEYTQALKEYLNGVASYYSKDENFDDETEEKMRSVFTNTFAVLANSLPNGIVRQSNKGLTTPALFEAIAVGAGKAYLHNGFINTEAMPEILDDEGLENFLGSGSNSKVKLTSRIKYCYDRFKIKAI